MNEKGFGLVVGIIALAILAFIGLYLFNNLGSSEQSPQDTANEAIDRAKENVDKANEASQKADELRQSLD